MSQKPLYRAELAVYDDVQLLRIWDLYNDASPTMTVTNGAEIVLSELQKTLGRLPTLIIYKDSSGEWDRLIWDGNFAAFRSVAVGAPRTTNDETALSQAVESFKRERITALPVERDKYGCWTHPEYDKFNDGRDHIPRAEFEDWLKAKGLESSYELRDDSFDVLGEEEYDADFNTWQPEPPDGEGWFIGSIHDSEDGPVCIWFRNVEGGAI